MEIRNIFMRFPGGRKKAVTLSYDDGVETDRRLMQIMDKHGLKGTFNINSGLFSPEGTTYPKDRYSRRLPMSEAVKLYTDCGHEVAIHGVSHPHLAQLPCGAQIYEIIEDRRKLEELFGYVIQGCAYPHGDVSDETVAALKACGIVYARTVESTEKFDMPKDWLRLPATCHHNNPRIFELCEEFLKADSWRYPTMFYLWGHSYEYDDNNNWNIIEKFAEMMGGHEDIWYATNIEIYRYEEAYRQLRFGVDLKFVENPTATDIWFSLKKRDYMVPAGGFLELDE